jgi:hypothetical protein
MEGIRDVASSVTAVSPVGIDLANRDELRKAIIYSEILQPPKGLRKSTDPWET